LILLQGVSTGKYCMRGSVTSTERSKETPLRDPAPPHPTVFEVFRIGEECCHQLIEEILGILDSRSQI